ncbi:MAG: hypothetical protein FWD26_04195 [Treponema sp.]|nr:hypothetical protein [Treponema sp.]
MKKNICKLFMVFIILGFLVNSCEEYVSLGPTVNTEFPVINSVEDGKAPGSYLWGTENMIYLEIIQEFGIASAFMEIWYDDDNQYKVIEMKEDDDTGYWFVNIDTTGMPDGNIRAKVTATDVDGKSTTTTEMIYIIKNSLPQIEMAFPAISGDDFDDPELNVKLLDILIITGSDLIGIASDSYGIAAGYPKIMFWPQDEPLNEEGVPVNPKWAMWHTVVDDEWKEVDAQGQRVVQFRWPLVNLIEEGSSFRMPKTTELEALTPGKYNFKLQVRDDLGDKNLNTYPNRVDNKFGETDTSALENQFITINLIAAENPIIWMTDIPAYYNGGFTRSDDFVAHIRVESENTILSVRAKVTNDDSVSFAEADENVVTDNLDKTYTIRIPFDQMPKTGGEVVSGEKTLHVEVLAEADKRSTAYKTFILDIDPPTLEFSDPLGFETDTPPHVTSRLTFRGAANDNKDGRVSRLYYALGVTETAAASASLDPTVNTGWHDTLLHTGSPLSSHPGFGGIAARWGGSLSSWNWRFDDINDLCNTGNRANYVRDMGSNLWELPIFFKVVDIAGNVKIYEKKVIINPNMDLPVVEIISHENNMIVGGNIRVNGTAKDNEMIHSVEIRVTAQSDPDCDTANAPSNVVVNWTAVTGVNRSSQTGWYYDLNTDGSLNPPVGKGLRNVLIEIRALDAYANTPDTAKQYGPVEALTISFSRDAPVIENIKIIKSDSSQADYVPGIRVSGNISIQATIRSVTELSSVTLRAIGETTDTEVLELGSYVTNNGIIASRYDYLINIPVNTNTLYPNNVSFYNITLQAFDSTEPAPFRSQTTFYLDVDNFFPYASFNGNINAVGNYTISGAAFDGVADTEIQAVQQVVVYFSRNNVGVSLWENTEFAATRQWVNAPQNARIGRTSAAIQGTLTPLPLFPNVRQVDGTFATTNSGIVINDNGTINGYSMSFTGNPDKNWSVIFDSTRLNPGPVTLHYVVFDAVGNASHYTRDIYIANNSPVINNIRLGTDILGGGTVEDDDYESFTVWRTEIPTSFRIRNNLFNLKLNVARGNGALSYRVYGVNSRTSVSAAEIRIGNVYTINDPGNIQWINYGVFESPPGGMYSGVTFTATSDYIQNSGTGTVWTYAQGAAATVRTAALPNSETVISFNASAFGTGLILDSPKDANGYITTSNERYFIIKVYDSTVTPPAENNQLASAAVIRLDIDNTDAQRPVVNIDPFYWNSASDNSLYENNKTNGHIELETDLPAAFNQTAGLRDRDPKVSGKVSFRGTATDNNRITALWFRITNFTDTDAVQGTGDLAGYYRAAVISGTSSTSVDRFESNGWKFTVIPNEPDLDGHRISWQLDFDSRFITGVASLDNILTVVAFDGPNQSTVATTQTTAASKTSRYRFDVVPYITGISTDVRSGTNGWGLKDNNIRSADGKYSIIQAPSAGTASTSFITVRGFNLPANTANSVRILSASANSDYLAAPTGAVPTGAGVTNFTPANSNTDRTSFTMTNWSESSGYLTVLTGTIGSLNNINNKDSRLNNVPGLLTDGSRQENMPNREADRYLTKNIMLTNDRYLQFYTVRKTAIINGYYPAMLINNNSPTPNNVNTPSTAIVFSYIDHRVSYDIKSPGTSGPSDGKIQRIEYNMDGSLRRLEYLLKVGNNAEQMAMAIDDSGRYGHFTSSSFGANGSGTGGSSDFIYDRYAELWNEPTGLTIAGWARGISNIHSYSLENNRVRTFDSHNTAINFEASMDPGTPLDPNNTPNPIWKDFVANIPKNVAAGVFNTQQTAPNVVPKNSRFWYPKLIMRGNSVGGADTFAANYLAYYDEGTTNKQIIFRTFQVGTAQTLAGTPAQIAAMTEAQRTAGRYYRLSHHSTTDALHVDYQNRRYTTWTNYPISRVNGATAGITDDGYPAVPGNYNAAFHDTYYQLSRWNNERYLVGNYGRNIAATGASRYFDMGLVGTGTSNRVVLVYFDEDQQRLRLSYSNSAAIDGSGVTSGAHVFTENTSITFPPSVGMYVSIFIDTSNRIHIAAYDSINTELKYILVPSYNAASYEMVTIDQYGAVGLWADIKVRNNRPYIAYYNAAEGGGRDSLKLAFAKNAIAVGASVTGGVDANGFTTGAWEYRTIPALDPPQGGIPAFQKVNLDFLTHEGGGYTPVLGYLGSNLEFSYPVGE